MSKLFDLSKFTPAQRSSGSWAAALLLALARDEVAGRRRQRLMEPKHATWARFRGRLTSVDFLALLFEDAAVLHPLPFDPALLDSSLRFTLLSEQTVAGWLQGIQTLPLDMPGAEYIADQARRLGLPTRLARSELHVVKPHQKVLELPGTGGQLAHHLASSQSDLVLQDNFVVAGSNWQELTLAGVVGLELGAPNTECVVRADIEDFKNSEHPLRQRSFDFVLGLHPDKGGLFQAADQLEIWFPAAKILLV